MHKHCIRWKLKFNAMEKVCHPMCTCGQPVMVHESWSANYDDGGSVDSFDVDIEYDVVCERCYIMATPTVTIEPRAKDEDELPF